MMIKHIYRLFLPLLLIVFTAMSCNHDYEDESSKPQHSTLGFVSFDTRAQTSESINQDNADFEDRVNTIRFIACVKSTGEVLHNEVHPLADLINFKKEIQLPAGTYDFFFVANETAAMTTALNEVTFRDGLYQKTALTQVPAAIPLLEHIDRNVGIPMTAQLSNTITAANKKGNSLKLDVKLIRTLAKVTLNLQRALKSPGNLPTDAAAPLELKSIKIANISKHYPLFITGSWTMNVANGETDINTGLTITGNQKLTRTFYVPEYVRWAGGGNGLRFDFTFSKHGIERTKSMYLDNGDKSTITAAGFSDFIKDNLNPQSVARNAHYAADVELKGWDEEIIHYNWTILPWNKESSQKDYAVPQVVIPDNPANGQQGVTQDASSPNWLNLDPTETDRITMNFKVTAPQGALWRFNLTNYLDFEFANEAATSGMASNDNITITVVAKKPWSGYVRSTELYLTVDGKEVQIVKRFRDTNQSPGPTKRFMIRQTI